MPVVIEHGHDRENPDYQLEAGMRFIYHMNRLLHGEMQPSVYVKSAREEVRGERTVYFEVENLDRESFRERVLPEGYEDFDQPQSAGDRMRTIFVHVYPMPITLPKDTQFAPMLSGAFKRYDEEKGRLRQYLPYLGDFFKWWTPEVLPVVFYDLLPHLSGDAGDWLGLNRRDVQRSEPWEVFNERYGHLGFKYHEMLTVKSRQAYLGNGLEYWGSNVMRGALAEQGIEVGEFGSFGNVSEEALGVAMGRAGEVVDEFLEEYLGIGGASLEERVNEIWREFLPRADGMVLEVARALELSFLMIKHRTNTGRDVVALSDFPPGGVIIYPNSQEEIDRATTLVAGYPAEKRRKNYVPGISRRTHD